MSTVIGAAQQVSNAQVPKEGPVSLRAQLDFTSGVAVAAIDLTQQTLPGPNFKLSYVQGVYVDNSLGTVDIVMIVGGTAQNIRFPAGTQTYAPIIAIVPPTFVFAGKNGASPNIIVPVYFLNVPMPAISLGQSSLGGFTFNDSNLLTQDTAAENSLGQLTGLIASGGLNVNVVSGGGSGGGFQGPLVWHNAVLGAGSGLAVLYTPTAGKRFYLNNFYAWLDWNSFSSPGVGQTLFWQLNDYDAAANGPMASGSIGLAGAAPTVVAGAAVPQPSPLLMGADDMGHRSQAVNGRLVFQWSSSNLSGGAVRFGFSMLQGDTT